MKKAVNWALVGTGGISNRFLTGLRAAEGGYAGAVASRSREKAEAFASKYGIEKAYDNFDRMLEDRAVEAVYIGVPHAFHRDLAVRALKAGKGVLCEKPAALNAAEAGEMVRTAGEHRAFFMEALWTRFTPPFCKVREWLKEGRIGEAAMVQANFGANAAFNPQSRLFDPAQGGGALLDLGIYPLALGSMVFGGEKHRELSSRLIFNEAGSDKTALGTVSYAGGRVTHFAASLGFQMVNDAWIYGTGGWIYLPNHVFSRRAELHTENRDCFCCEPDYVSNGYNYEAAAVMDCIREGKIECALAPWAETLNLAETMDAVRAQWGFKYPGE